VPLVDEATLVKMRADFERVTAHRLRVGGWSAADVQELGVVIKAAIDKGAPDSINGWAGWLSDLAADIAILDLDRAREQWHAERARESAHRHDETELREINRVWCATRLGARVKHNDWSCK
jgi:hypothetical protein